MMKKYTVSFPIFGHIHFVGIEAEDKDAAIEKGWGVFHGGVDPDDIEWETGYPCETGWPEADATEEK